MASSQEWQDKAACREVAVEMFFPPAEQESEVAKAVCSNCTVRQPCLDFAIAEGERFGIWGGLTTQERRTVAVKQRKTSLAAASEPLAPFYLG